MTIAAQDHLHTISVAYGARYGLHHRQPIAFACNSGSGKESAVRTGPVAAKVTVVSWSDMPPCAIGALISSLVKRMRLPAGRLPIFPAVTSLVGQPFGSRLQSGLVQMHRAAAGS